MNYYTSKTITGEYQAVIDQVTTGLKEIGFGVLTTIDVRKTLKEKIDVDFKPYVILGACNPHFASKALLLEDKLGVLLPCNVLVIDQGDGLIEVAAMDASAMIGALGNEKLTNLALEVSQRMEKMISSL
ncbi:MAG: DUF302 domain-containing protein [Bacteroidetes bacterium]|nr:DUF302 domain-containing protein [Bacteroidales bacterium]MBU1008603.1 DUF302 domain-containing protein [Bacteroidota bacterium]